MRKRASPARRVAPSVRILEHRPNMVCSEESEACFVVTFSRVRSVVLLPERPRGVSVAMVAREGNEAILLCGGQEG